MLQSAQMSDHLKPIRPACDLSTVIWQSVIEQVPIFETECKILWGAL